MVVALDAAGGGYREILSGPPQTSTMRIRSEHAAYCPPHTENDVTNTGNDTLRYVYVVSGAKK